MKKITKILLVIAYALIATISLAGCTKKIGQDSTINEKSTIYPVKVISVDYNYDFTTNTSAIINNYEALKEYCMNLNSDKSYIDDGKQIIETPYIPEELKTYNEEYFKTKSLALAYIAKSSISNEILANKAQKKDSTLSIYYTITSPEIGLTAMGADLLVVEIDKDISNITLINE